MVALKLCRANLQTHPHAPFNNSFASNELLTASIVPLIISIHAKPTAKHI